LLIKGEKKYISTFSHTCGFGADKEFGETVANNNGSKQITDTANYGSVCDRRKPE
jgi:hypothetical protein